MEHKQDQDLNHTKPLHGSQNASQTPAAASTEDAGQHMDGIYRYQRYIYDATRKYFLLGRDTLLDELDPPDGGSVLEVGCGTGAT